MTKKIFLFAVLVFSLGSVSEAFAYQAACYKYKKSDPRGNEYRILFQYSLPETDPMVERAQLQRWNPKKRKYITVKEPAPGIKIYKTYYAGGRSICGATAFATGFGLGG